MTFKRITCDPKEMNGQPCIRGMRLTVPRVLRLLANYPNWDEMLKDYPDLDEKDIKEALVYAATCLNGELLDLEQDSPKLAMELLIAAKSPFTPYSRQNLEAVAQQVLRETDRE
ncbi:MAG: DUF433 domain-containing protein [Verrucomicrobiota bacterium]